MSRPQWTAGIDLGGTKIQIIQINSFGTLGERIRCPTNVEGGAAAIEEEIVEGIKSLNKKIGSPASAVGIGVAGQVDAKTGEVKFAPNLKWSNVPIQHNLKKALGVPVVIMNDVRAATWGEWLYGAGKDARDLICIFVGTGVGGGIISDGKMLSGFNNTAGEIGHMTLHLSGPLCTCGNSGCLESYAGGWAIAKHAQEAVKKNVRAGQHLLKAAHGKIDDITGHLVIQMAQEKDPLCSDIVDQAIEALAAGTASLINILGPQKIIFGGGIIEGMPELIEIIAKKARQRALQAATENLMIVPAKLHNDAGAIGAGAFAARLYVK